MLRKLIALLVLVTGLAALGQPAQARIVDVDAARTAVGASYACAAQTGQAAVQFIARTQRYQAQSKACPKPPKIVLVVPTVMLKVDRARE